MTREVVLSLYKNLLSFGRIAANDYFPSLVKKIILFLLAQRLRSSNFASMLLFKLSPGFFEVSVGVLFIVKFAIARDLACYGGSWVCGKFFFLFNWLF